MSIETSIANFAPQHASLLAILGETDYAPVALKQQTKFVVDIESELAQATSRIKQLEKKTHVEKMEHEKYRDSRMKRFAYSMGGSKGKSKYNARVEKEASEYFDALQEETEMKERLENMGQALVEAKLLRMEYEQVARMHDDAQKQLDEIYAIIFSGPTPEFPEEDHSEWQFTHAEELFNDVQARYRNTNQALNLLVQARGKLTQAITATKTAYDYCDLDVVAKRSNDGVERKALSQAKSHAAQVTYLFDKARNYCPEIKPLRPLHIVAENMMAELLFENIFTDKAYRQELEKSSLSLRNAQTEINTQIESIQKNEGDMKLELDVAAMRLKDAREKLQKMRAAVFETVGPSPPAYSHHSDSE